ncbi:MAG: helix-turn-helix domain-containing protein, partial [Acidimicrobiales bacterium]
ATDWSARLGVLAGAVSDRLDAAPALDPVGVGLATRLAEHPGQPLHRLLDDVALSERQLRRRVEEAVGYSPRTLARIVRFQRFLHAARSVPRGRRNLAGLAAETGYADQAHLTRESRRLGGLPPAALLDWEAQRLGHPSS